MLELKGIKKNYDTGGETVAALRGVSIAFRRNEFVSVLGPSGCGKTTMLNIVGGLDRYSDGDLRINGRSTKEFSDRDWDAYRNHSIGFVFQSYNLIPHQTVLRNVELALTLSGVAKAERRRRAIKALEQVGLGNQLAKKPSQMSGGQMQRVAIARAIVNDPDIILADEPTGALDTETSRSVMEILKEIANDRLVVMVTHNPDLAEQYSTRIVTMLDGEVTGDTHPLCDEEYENEVAQAKKAHAETQKTKKNKRDRQKMPSMSLSTSFGLSLKNLISKKARTALTSFAGSIGIIGIALIFAVSNGMTQYINELQEDTLSSYPITLESKMINLGSMMNVFLSNAKGQGEHENDAVYQKSMIYDLVNALNDIDTTENDLRSFKPYLESLLKDSAENAEIREAINGIRYAYDLDLLVYTKNADGKIIRSDAEELMSQLMLQYLGIDMSGLTGMGEGSSSGTMSVLSSLTGNSQMVVWQEMLAGEDGDVVNPLLKKQYDLVYGSWPTAYNEIVLILDENNELDDMSLYALGLKSDKEIRDVMEAAYYGTELKYTQSKWSYEEITDMTFKVILNSSCYEKTDSGYRDLRESQTNLRILYDHGIELKVCGIIRPNPDATSTMMTGSIGYTSLLTEHVIREQANADAINAQKASPNVDVFTGLPFSSAGGSLDNAQKAAQIRSLFSSADAKTKAQAYIKAASIMPSDRLDAAVEEMLSSFPDAESLQNFILLQLGDSASAMESYVKNMDLEQLRSLITPVIEEKIESNYAEQIEASLADKSDAELAALFDAALAAADDDTLAVWFDNEVVEFSDSTYEANLKKLGYVELDDPSEIYIYASSFESKAVIENAIKTYNSGVDEISKLTYVDYVGLMMSAVTSIIDAITYVLVGFVSVSLIVSSIMIGVITLISVQERTKEIGILRAVGASKRNVSQMFNAETVIIGFISGVLGIGVTYLLCLPINAILHRLTGISSLSASLPLPIALALVLISVVLTLISGIIPSKNAARKDPVIALRTE